MRILYVAMKYDYGRPNQGPSFEHYNFYDCLLQMGHDIVYFDFMTLMQEHGQTWMNSRLMEVAKTEKPDLIFNLVECVWNESSQEMNVAGLYELLGVPTQGQALSPWVLRSTSNVSPQQEKNVSL